jgi:hypothetical protein
VSANDSGSGTGIWGMARLAAPAVVALALAGVALPWILDAGTVHLPAVGVGVSTNSSSGPPAVAKIVVVKPTRNSAGTQHHSHPAGTSAAQSQAPQSATGHSTQAGDQAATSPVVHHPTHPSPTASTRTAAPPSPVIKSTPRSHKPTPPTKITGKSEGDQGNESPATPSHHGRALGHEKHAFRVRAAEDKGEPPRGLALGHRHHAPPGQARKEGRPPHGLALGHRNHVPPGQARKHGESGHQGGDDEDQNSQDDDNDSQGHNSHGHHGDEQGHGSHGHHGDASPGHDDGSQGADSHGRGHGH